MLHRFSQLVVACTVILILAGSLVTSTGSGLAVPDWPTTYGWNMFTFPPSMWVGGIFYEHGHRLIASMVGLLTVFYSLLTAGLAVPLIAGLYSDWAGPRHAAAAMIGGMVGLVAARVLELPARSPWLSEAVVGLALVLAIYRGTKTVLAENMNILKG